MHEKEDMIALQKHKSNSWFRIQPLLSLLPCAGELPLYRLGFIELKKLLENFMI